MDLAVRHLAAAKDSDLDHRSLGNLAQQLTTKIVGAVVERDHWNAAQHHRPEALLGLFHAFQRGDDRTKPTSGDRGSGVDEIALTRSRHVGTNEEHRSGGE